MTLPAEYPSLADVERDFPDWSPEYKSAAWFFEAGAISVRIRRYADSNNLVSLDAALPERP